MRLKLDWFGLCASLVFGAGLQTQAALTRLDISYYRDYAVQVRVGGRNEALYASALTASYLPGAHNGAVSSPLPLRFHNDLTVFSLDVRPRLVSGAYWESQTLPANDVDNREGDAAPGWNPGGIYRAASLYQAYAREVNSFTTEGRLAGAALQLAIWDVLYGDAKAVNHRHSGFYISAADDECQLIFAANAMLASSANALDKNAQETFWDAALGPNGRRPFPQNQDFLGPAMMASFVPEPSTWGAGAMALSYLLLTTRWARFKRSNNS